MRVLTDNAQGKVDQNLGTEPIIIVRIDWDAGVKYYGDKSFPLDALTIKGKILECEPVNAQEKLDSLSEVSSVGVTLFDDDGSLKALTNTEIIEGLDCIIYQHFEGNAQADLIPLLVGKIISPINWHEGERQLSFEVETYIEDNEVGYAPEEGSILNLHEDAVDVPWPLCFGTVIHVPCIRIRHAPEGRLRYGINQNFETFVVEGGEDFPQDTSIQINVGGILYTGSFDGNTFTATTRNDTWHTAIALQNRKMSDTHVQDPSVCWIDSDDHIAGLYVKVTHPTYGTCINYCVSQSGKKCFFRKPFRAVINPFQDLILDSNSDIDETASIPRSSWGANFVVEVIYRGIFGTETQEGYLAGFELIVLAGIWRTPSGAKVRLVKDYNDLYVANLIPSVEILDVFGYRRTEGDRKFEPIPSSYYTVNLSDSLDGQSPTTFEFAIALEDYLDEGWDGNVYVSLRSSQGSNSASTIRYLLENYSNITPDATSFDQTILDVAPYLSSFAVFDRPNVLSLVDSVTWQAACSLVIRSGQAFIRFLAMQHDADLGISETEVELKTLQLGFTETEEIWTKLIATWKIDYSGDEDAEKEYIYRNNEDVFGLKEQEIDFFIYNTETMLKLFVDYWGYKKSNIWRKCIFNTFLEGVVLDPYDIIEVAVAKFSTNNIRALVEHASYDSEESAVIIEAELWSKAGDVDGGDEPIEDEGYYLGDPNNPIDPINNPTDPEDPGDGREEVDYDIPGDNQTSPTDPGPDEDEEEGGENPTLYLSFSIEPIEVERGTNFSLQIVIKDSNGNLISKNVSGTLVLGSSDGSDVLNISNINFVNGIWSSATAQITAGSGDDSGIIQVSAPNIIEGGLTTRFQSASTNDFGIIDPMAITLSWDVSPGSVDRDVTFSVQISGGKNNGVLEVQLNSTDGGDLLYNGSGLITQITLDGSGNYSASDWYIVGGNGDDNGTMTLHDPAREYEDETCPQFSIAELSPQHVQQTIEFTQIAQANSNRLVLDPDGIITSSVLFHNAIIIQDSDGDLDTSWNGNVKITAYDNVGTPLTWLGAGSDAQNYGSYIIVPVTSGQWEADDCRLLIPETAPSPIRFIGEDLDSDLTGFAISQIGTLKFDITCPSAVTRGGAFNLVIQAKDEQGELLTTYIPATQVDINLTSDDVSDVIAPLFTNNTGWSNGTKTVSCAITGGAGIDAAIIECIDADSDHNGETSLTVSTGAPTIYSFSVWEKKAYAGLDVTNNPDALDGSALGEEEFWQSQYDARVSFENDTALGLITDQARRYVEDVEPYADFQCIEEGGYSYYIPTDFAVSVAVAVHIDLYAYIREKSNLLWPNWSWSSKANTCLLKVIASPSVNIYSGLSLEWALPIAAVQGTWCNQMSVQAGGTPAVPGIFRMQLPLSILDYRDPVTKRLYIWFYWISSILPYDMNIWSGGTGANKRIWEARAKPSSLKLYGP